MKTQAEAVAAKLGEIKDWCQNAMQMADVASFSGQVEEEINRALRFFEVSPAAAAVPSPDMQTIPLSVLDAVRVIRLAGQLPYYLTRAIGCWFAAKYGRKVSPAEIGEICGMTFEVQFLHQAADACAAVLDKKPLLEAPKRVALLKKAYEAGYYNEKVFRGCAQCTLAALFDVIGNKNPEVFRMTNTFASGMGLFGDGPCGGYSGGLLFLGHYAGRRLEHIEGDKEEKDLAMKLSDLLHTKFIETYGTVICHGIHRDIFGREFHIRNADEKQGFEDAGAHQKDKCPAVVGTAAMWTVEILLDEGFVEV